MAPAPACEVACVEAAFAAAMARLGPFEDRPRLAAGVSGGADSLALALIADRWCRSRGGRLTALVVDHGLRAESAREAAETCRRLDTRGIAATVLSLELPARRRNLQATARAERYRAMTGWCRARGILHLLVAHHRDDQAETLYLRLESGSGLDGLAAMPAVQTASGCRLLRPLLSVPTEALRRFLGAEGLDWIEDPTNRDACFSRVRVRRTLAALPERLRAPARTAETARCLGVRRREGERRTETLAAAAVSLRPEGYALLDPAPLAAADPEIGLRLLARLIRCLGGASHAPPPRALQRIYVSLQNDGVGRGATVGGCRILPSPSGKVLVCREAGRAETVRFRSEGMHWDGRFMLRSKPGPDATIGDDATVGPLGESGWAECVRLAPWLRSTPLPLAVRLSVPAVRQDDAVVAVPDLGYLASAPKRTAEGPVVSVFRPRRALCEPAFVPVGDVPEPTPGKRGTAIV